MAINPAELSQGAPSSPEPTGQQQPPGQGSPTPGSEHSLYAEFLQQVPEAQRPLIEPYVKKWDAGVTKRFQDLHSKVRPYEEIGADPEVLTQAYALYQALEERPEEIYNVLKDVYGTGEQGVPGQQAPGAEEEEVYQNLPPEFVQRMERSERLLEQVAQFILTSRQKETEATEDAELDSYLDDLAEQHGQFDRDWVMVRIAQGMDPEQAVQGWQSMLQEQLNALGAGDGNGTPPTLHGGGVLPQETVNMKDLGRKDVRSMVAGLLSQANQGGD